MPLVLGGHTPATSWKGPVSLGRHTDICSGQQALRLWKRLGSGIWSDTEWWGLCAQEKACSAWGDRGPKLLISVSLKFWLFKKK